MVNYTKGEWGVFNDCGERIIFANNPQGGTTDIASMECQDISISELVANAHLIAAAPALYEALDYVRACQPDLPGQVVVMIQKALAKAEGKQNG